MPQLNTAALPSLAPPPLLSPYQPPVMAMAAGYYLVALPSLLGSTTHIVRKDRACACPLAAACPAVQAVADYLRQGGTKAPDPKAGSLIPATCPICGGPVCFEPRLCSPMRGAGWVCLASAQFETHLPRYWYPGERHYWAHMWAELGRLRFGSQP